MGLQDIKPNEEWWNPPLMPDFVLRSKYAYYECTHENLKWAVFSEELFFRYPEDIRRTMFLYLKWCKKNSHKPKYMIEGSVDLFHNILPYVFKVMPAKIRNERYHYLYPKESLLGVKFPNNRPASYFKLKSYLTPQIRTQWLKEATEWLQDLLRDSTNSLEDLRDAMYRVDQALNSENPATRSYVEGWLQGINEKHNLS